MIIDNIWSSVNKSLKKNEKEKVNVKTELKDYAENVQDVDLKLARKLVNRVIPGNFDFVKAKKSTYDLGVINMKCTFDSELGVSERISYFSLLDKFKSTLESSIGMSSRGIKITGLKILIDKKTIGNSDRFVVYKYCPVNENISTTSTGGRFFNATKNAQPSVIEYANEMFFGIKVAEGDYVYYMNSLTLDKSLVGPDTFYVNFENPYYDKIDALELLHKNLASQISVNKLNDYYANQFLTVNLSHTDNDVIVLFFNELEKIDVVSKIKVVFNVEISKEDLIQNFTGGSKINDVILRNLIMTKSKNDLKELYSFALSVKSNISTVLGEAYTAQKDNLFVISLYNKWKNIHKTLLSISTYGASKANIHKLVSFIQKYIPIKMPKNRKISEIPLKIYKSILAGLDLSLLLTIGNDGNKQNVLSKFIQTFITVGNIPLEIGDDRTILYSALASIDNMSGNINWIENNGKPTIVDKIAVIKNSVERVEPDIEPTFWDIDKKQLINPNINDDIIKQNAAAVLADEEYNKAVNAEIANLRLEYDDNVKELASLRQNAVNLESQITTFLNANSKEISDGKNERLRLSEVLKKQEAEKQMYEQTLGSGGQVDSVAYAKLIEEYQKNYDQYMIRDNILNQLDAKVLELGNEKAKVKQGEQIIIEKAKKLDEKRRKLKPKK